MNERHWLNVDLGTETAERFKDFLRQNGIKYEPSACFTLVHFEVYVNNAEAEACDKWLSNN